MKINDFWKTINQDLAQLNAKNISEVVKKYVIILQNQIWWDEFGEAFGVHKSLCVQALCKEIEIKAFFALLTGITQDSVGDNIIEDIRDTMMAICTLESVLMN